MLFFPLSPALMLLENYLTSLTDQTGANFDLLGILVSSGANSSIAEWKRKLVLKKLVGKKKAKNEDSTASWTIFSSNSMQYLFSVWLYEYFSLLCRNFSSRRWRHSFKYSRPKVPPQHFNQIGVWGIVRSWFLSFSAILLQTVWSWNEFLGMSTPGKIVVFGLTHIWMHQASKLQKPLLLQSCSYLLMMN